MKQLEDFTPLLNQPDLLIEKAEEYGYMYFKQLVSKKEVDELRKIILNKMKPFGWLSKNHSIEEMIVSNGVNVGESHKDDWITFYKEIIKLEELTNIAFEPSILNVVNMVMKPPVLPHCRKVFRAYSPTKNPYATPPHRDYTWTGGTKNFWTAWLPLTNITTELGGLSLIQGSHKMQLESIDNDERKGWKVPEHLEWSTSNYFEMGDVVFFTGWTIHAGSNNNTKNRIRLSLDFRYQNVDEPIRKDSLCAHWNEVFEMDWEEIYKKWSKDNSFKYYWKKFKNVEEETEKTFKQSMKNRYLLHKLMNTFKK